MHSEDTKYQIHDFLNIYNCVNYGIMHLFADPVKYNYNAFQYDRMGEELKTEELETSQKY